MKLAEIVEKMGLEIRGTVTGAETEVTGGYTSDLLSDVLANCRDGNVWITLQIHPNIVAVASMKGAAAIVLINGREPAEETLERANNENIPVLVSQLPAFELIGRLYALGLRGMTDDVHGG